MRQSFNLDGLVDYRADNVPDTLMVVNPAHRALDGEVRKKVGLLNRRIAEFGALKLSGEIEPAKVEAYAQKKSDLQEVIMRLKTEIDQLKAQRKATQRHIAYKDLPVAARFDRLSTQSKHLADTVKMIAYRAETAMAQIVRQMMSRHDDARSLLRAVYSTEIDLIPDHDAKTLTVRIHPLANTSSDQALKHLCAEINATETQFPGTELRLIYELVAAKTP
jgi:outer membrane murein-binding lipoprotein Lpp